jgi:MFS family permease
LLKREYPKDYTSDVSTRVSNALLVGEIFGQVVIGLTCDYLGRKFTIITTTALIVIGGILATASNGVTVSGLFWMLTVSRGIVGFGAGGKSALVLLVASVGQSLIMLQVNILPHPLRHRKPPMSIP